MEKSFHWKLIALPMLLLIGALFSAETSAQEGAQALKVKSIVGGGFDAESRNNFQRLMLKAIEEGTVLIWIASKAPYDPDLTPEMAEYEIQRMAIQDFHRSLLEDIHVSPSKANFSATGPFVSVHVDHSVLPRLLVNEKVKGYWGIVSID